MLMKAQQIKLNRLVQIRFPARVFPRSAQPQPTDPVEAKAFVASSALCRAALRQFNCGCAELHDKLQTSTKLGFFSESIRNFNVRFIAQMKP